jgi:hypothetical protein
VLPVAQVEIYDLYDWQILVTRGAVSFWVRAPAFAVFIGKEMNAAYTYSYN